MEGYQKIADGSGLFFERSLPSTSSTIRLAAQEIRKERTGTHARLTVWRENTPLAYSIFNVDRDEERVRLANSAHRSLGEIEATGYSKEALKEDMDFFCHGLWTAWVGLSVPEPTVGDIDYQVPMILLPYVAEGAGTILFAPPGRGKSYVGMLKFVSIDSGSDMLWKTKQRVGLLVNLERSPQSVAGRLAHVNFALGLPHDRPALMLHARGRSLVDVRESVQETIRKHGVEFVMVDSISRAGVGSLTEDKPANQAIDILNGWGVAWYAIAHTPRGDNTHSFGSIMFEAGADFMLKLVSEQKDSQLGIALEMTKANDAPFAPRELIALHFDSNGLGGVSRPKEAEFPKLLLAEETGPVERILGYLGALSERKATQTQIAQSLNMDISNVGKLLHGNSAFVDLGKQGREVYFGRAVPVE